MVTSIDAVNDKITFATLVDILAGTEIKLPIGADNETSLHNCNDWRWHCNMDYYYEYNRSYFVLAAEVQIIFLQVYKRNTNTNPTNEAVFSGYSVSDPILYDRESDFYIQRERG